MSKDGFPTYAGFPKETAWSLVLGAADRNSPEHRDRLESLARQYWKPVFWFLVHRWHCKNQDASDLTQEFFSHLCEEGFLTQASPGRGRFRTFIGLKLKDLVLHDLRRRSALKRGGGLRPVSLDGPPDGLLLQMKWPGATPDEEFDRVWAACILSDALEELRATLKKKGERNMIRAFWACVVDDPPMSYRDCARELGVKVSDVGNLIFCGRAEIQKIIFRKVHDTVDHESDREDEFRQIMEALDL